MNLDVLKTEWAARDAKLEGTLRLNTRLLKATLAGQRRGVVERLLPFGWTERIVWAIAIGLLALFIADHVDQPRFLVPAFLMLAWTIVTGAVGFQQRAAMLALDYGQPAVEVQRKLAKIRIARLLAFKWSFLTGQVVWWVPLLIVLFAALGVDLYGVSQTVAFFLAANVAAGLLFIPVAAIAAKRVSARFERSPRFQRLLDAIAGEDIAAARAFLDELGRYENLL